MTRNLKEIVNQDLGSRTIPDPASSHHVVVLLALYNGATMLGEQLDSLACQQHSDWSLIISDDGSRDAWRKVVADFAARNLTNRISVMNGPRRGFARNFLSLLQAAGPIVPFAAFCDQDDVWREEKLTTALRALSRVPTGVPAIYCGRTEITNQALQPLGRSPLFRKPPSFRNALVQSIAGGNTMVMNRAALDILQDTARYAKGIVSHDWWAYQMISGAGGVVIYDPAPQVLYRQHSRNRIGANGGWVASLKRSKLVFRGRYRQWNKVNLDALEQAEHWLTQDARTCLDQFRRARNASLPVRLRALRASGVTRQTRKGTLALWFAALIHRL